MVKKACALCSAEIEHIKDPALLFIGKYGRRYEICFDCEKLMDTLVSPSFHEERNTAAKTVYHHLFEENEPKSPELLSFFSKLLAENSETMLEAQENLEEYEEEERRKQEEAQALADQALNAAEAAATDAIDGVEPSEEEFLADEEKPVKLWVKLLFLFLFLLLGGGAIAYGIIASHIPMTVIGAIVLLVGIATVFSKD